MKNGMDYGNPTFAVIDLVKALDTVDYEQENYFAERERVVKIVVSLVLRKRLPRIFNALCV